MAAEAGAEAVAAEVGAEGRRRRRRRRRRRLRGCPVLEVVSLRAPSPPHFDAVALVALERVGAVPGDHVEVAAPRVDGRARHHLARLPMGDGESEIRARREVLAADPDALGRLVLVPRARGRARRVRRRQLRGVRARRRRRRRRRGRRDAAGVPGRLSFGVPVLARVRPALAGLGLVRERRDDVLGVAAVALPAHDAVHVGRVLDVLAVPAGVADGHRLPAPGLRLLSLAATAVPCGQRQAGGDCGHGCGDDREKECLSHDPPRQNCDGEMLQPSPSPVERA